MKLSANFDLSEFTKSALATRYGIDNTPTAEQIESLKRLCVNVLEPVRLKFGPVLITSGFRSDALNKKTRGSKNSQHCLGEAADIEVKSASTFELFDWIRQHVEFDQLILELHDRAVPRSGWVHVSYREGRLRGDVIEAVRLLSGKTQYRPWK